MKDDSGPRGFGTIRRTLNKMLFRELGLLIGDLYSLSPENRRFLQSRFGERSKQLADCRELIADCMYPHPRPSAPTRGVIAADWMFFGDFVNDQIDDLLANVDISEDYKLDEEN